MEIKDSMSADEFNQLMKQGVFRANKKGKLVQQELLPEYENILQQQQKQANIQSGEERYIIHDLPKISLNKWYAGIHWSKRVKIKEKFKELIPPLNIANPCECTYDFIFKNNPLDASNCVGIIKIVEDIIFVTDGYNIVKKITITSNKGKRDCLMITIKYL